VLRVMLNLEWIYGSCIDISICVCYFHLIVLGPILSILS
jgi:hypothetical protein